MDCRKSTTSLNMASVADKMTSSQSISKIAYTLCICHWIFGMGIIQYPLGTRHPRISLAYSSICVASYCSVSALAYPHIMIWSAEMGKMAMSMKLLFFSNIIVSVGIVVLAWVRSESTFISIKKVMMVNDLMEHVGINVNVRQMRLAVARKVIIFAILIAAFVAAYVALIITREAPWYGKIAAGISLCYPVVIMFIADMAFVMRVSVIDRKYQILNDTLRNMLTSGSDLPRHQRLVRQLTNEENKVDIDTASFAINDPMRVIRMTKVIHLQLAKLCEEVNDTYGVQILLSIVAAFTVITGSIYVSYMLLQDDHIKRSIVLKAVCHTTVWSLYYAVKISNFTRACSECKEKATETGDLLNKFYDDPLANNEIQSEIRDFNVNLLQRPLNFTAAGWIALDARLMQIMTTTITTFLMILIQLGKVTS